MATYAENLTTARNNIAARLAEITAAPKPNYSLDGESYSWSEYHDMLTRQLEKLEGLLSRAAGPFEVRSQGFT